MAADFRFAGTAVDSYNRPVADAQVRLFFEEIQPPLPSRTVLKTNTASTADGTFEISVPHGHGYIVVSKPGLGAAWRLWNEAGEFADLVESRFVLYEESSVSGVVVDEQGRPEAGALVFVSDAYFERDNGAQIYDRVSSPWLRECLRATTDANGRFRIQGIPQDSTFNLGISKPGKTLRQKRGARTSVSLNTMLCVDGETGIHLSTEPTGRIEGKVSMPTGAGPLPPGTRLWLQDQDRNQLVEGQWVEPAADGAYCFDSVPAGSYWVHAGFGTNLPPAWVADAAEATVFKADTNDNINITATQGGILQAALVLTNSDAPAADVSISTFRQSYQNTGGPSQNGLLQMRLPASAYQLELWREGTRIKRTNAETLFGKTNSIKLSVEPASRIGGIATNRLGAAMAGVKVFVFPACGSCSQAAARTGSNGIYSIPWDTHSKVGNDSFFLIARDAKRNLAGLADIEPDETNYDILLNRGLSIQGSVQDAEGHPLTNAVVTLAVWSGQGGDWFEEHNPPKLDTNGQFSFPALPRSRIYSIRATVRGYNQQDTSKIHGDTDTSTEIILPPLVLQRAEAKISGHVVDGRNNPVPWADVFVNAPNQPGHHVRADAGGAFSVEELAPGKALVSVLSRMVRTRQTVESGETNVVIMLGEEQAPEIVAPPPATTPAPVAEPHPLGAPWQPWKL